MRTLLTVLCVAVFFGCETTDGAGGADSGGVPDVGAPEDVPVGVDVGGASDTVAREDTTPADIPVVPLPTAAQMLEPGPYTVGVTSLALVDESRGVMANGDWSGAETRALPTEVWYPSSAEGSGEQRDAPIAEGGPFPLVVYSHGFMTRPRDNVGLLMFLASHGYVVAGVEFPLTNIFAKGGANAADVINQPDDVKFVIDHLLAASAESGHVLEGATDGEMIALIGVSLGAMTTALTAFHEDFADDRVDLVATMALPGCYVPDAFFAGHAKPMLLVFGDLDVIIPYDESVGRVWDLAAESEGPRYLMTIHGGTHTGFADAPARFMDALDNPDTVGCAAIGDNVSATVEALAPLVKSFGGDDYDVLRARCHSPCEGIEEFPLAQKATIQAELMFVGVRAFLDAWVKDDLAARRFLAEGLAPERPDQVSMESFVPSDFGGLARP